MTLHISKKKSEKRFLSSIAHRKQKMLILLNGDNMHFEEFF